MGYAVGERDGRDIGYGVPATCDHPGCGKRIDRGMAYLCEGVFELEGDEPEGSGTLEERGCGLFFCEPHGGGGLCERCEAGQPPFEPTPDVEEWTKHKRTDPSWAAWRAANGIPEPAGSSWPCADYARQYSDTKINGSAGGNPWFHRCPACRHTACRPGDPCETCATNRRIDRLAAAGDQR